MPASTLVPSVIVHGTFGVLAQRDARHAEHGRLLLDASRVGQHDTGSRRELEEVEVPERLHDGPSRRIERDPVRRGSARARPRVNREHDADLLGDLVDRFQQRPQRLRIVHVARAVQGEQRVLSLAHAERLEHVRLHGAPLGREQRVDHHVAHEDDALSATPSFARFSTPAGSDTNRTSLMASVSLRLISLGHVVVEAAQTRLDVDHELAAVAHRTIARERLLERQFGGDERARDGGVHVADDDHPCGCSAMIANGSNRFIISAVCAACEAAPDLQLDLGPRNRESSKNTFDMAAS